MTRIKLQNDESISKFSISEIVNQKISNSSLSCKISDVFYFNLCSELNSNSNANLNVFKTKFKSDAFKISSEEQDYIAVTFKNNGVLSFYSVI